MAGLKRFACYWLPVVFWMAVIFTASTDLLSSQNTSRFIGPFLRRLFPNVSDETIRQVQRLIRKTGHVTEYAVLAVLLRRALRASVEASGRQKRRFAGPGMLAFLMATLYAVTDEIHQAFVASRSGSAWDVLLDALGAAAGLGAVWLWERARRHKDASSA